MRCSPRAFRPRPPPRWRRARPPSRPGVPGWRDQVHDADVSSQDEEVECAPRPVPEGQGDGGPDPERPGPGPAAVAQTTQVREVGDPAQDRLEDVVVRTPDERLPDRRRKQRHEERGVPPGGASEEQGAQGGRDENEQDPGDRGHDRRDSGNVLRGGGARRDGGGGDDLVEERRPGDGGAGRVVHPPVEPGHPRPVLGYPFGAERVVVRVAIRHEDDAFRGEDLRPGQEADREREEGDHDERSPARPVASIPRVHEPVGVAHPPGERKGKDAAWWTAAAAVVMAGFALRVLGARGDLWLDEVWSVELAQVAGLAGAVFTQLHHDNNHHLNTLWLLALGYEAGELPLRMLAVAAGTAMVAVAALGAARERALSLAWAFLLAFSYVAIHYGSEARGYGLALLLAVTGYVSMDRFLLTRRLAWAMAFAVSAVLGLLSHLTFLYAQLAFLAWGAAVAWRERRKRGLHAGLLVALMPPALCFAALWAVDLRFLIVGRGPEYQLWSVLRELVRTTFGIPRGPLEWLALPVLLLPAAELSRLARARDLRWVYFMAVILVGPAAVLLISRPEYLAPRYFLLAVPFLLWLTAAGALRLARTGRTGLSVVTALAVLFLAGNGAYVARLLRDGRGQYREALAFIVRSESGPVATVGSDHDFRNATVIGRLLPGLPGAARFRYVQAGEWSDASPSWVLVHHFTEDPLPDPVILGPTGRRYDLVRVFPYAGLSGWDWYVYRMAQGAR